MVYRSSQQGQISRPYSVIRSFPAVTLVSCTTPRTCVANRGSPAVHVVQFPYPARSFCLSLFSMPLPFNAAPWSSIGSQCTTVLVCAESSQIVIVVVYRSNQQGQILRPRFTTRSFPAVTTISCSSTQGLRLPVVQPLVLPSPML